MCGQEMTLTSTSVLWSQRQFGIKRNDSSLFAMQGRRQQAKAFKHCKPAQRKGLEGGYLFIYLRESAGRGGRGSARDKSENPKRTPHSAWNLP